MASSGEAADCNKLNAVSLPFPTCRRTYGGHEKRERPSLEIDLSTVGYCRHMAGFVEEDLLPL